MKSVLLEEVVLGGRIRVHALGDGHRRRLVHRRGHNDEAHQIAGLIVHNRLPGKKTRVVIDIGKMHVFFIVHTLAQHFAPVTLRHLLSHMVAGQAVA